MNDGGEMTDGDDIGVYGSWLQSCLATWHVSWERMKLGTRRYILRAYVNRAFTFSKFYCKSVR
jgi:hypothetical protein